MIHIEVLVEDQSGARMVEHLLAKLIDPVHTRRIHSFKGIGRVPKKMSSAKDVKRKTLLDNLPGMLSAYGKTFSSMGDSFQAAILVVCDLDDNDRDSLHAELLHLIDSCNPKPNAHICFAVEEGEAWLLGDTNAIFAAFPKAKASVLNSYVSDSICGTWERLADAVYPGGHKALLSKGYQSVGSEKLKWADRITPHMVPSNNQSPSFGIFCKLVARIAGSGNNFISLP